MSAGNWDPRSGTPFLHSEEASNNSEHLTSECLTHILIEEIITANGWMNERMNHSLNSFKCLIVEQFQ